MKTVQELFETFRGFHKTPESNVIVHMNQYPYEFTAEFMEKVEKDLGTQINMSLCGLDDLPPVTQFVIHLLQDAY